MGLSLVEAPAVEPLSLAEAKLHLRLDTDDENPLVRTLIRAAREYVETATQRALVTQTWDWHQDAFPCAAETWRFPLGNVRSVTSLTYVDRDGVTQTWSSAKYVTDLPAGPKAAFGRIEPAYGEFYPLTRSQLNAVTVRFVAGYGGASSVPDGLKAAMKLLIGHWYMNRESIVVGVGIGAATVPQAVDALCWSYRAF